MSKRFLHKRLEFHISYFCPNNCIFCSEQDQLIKFSGQFVQKVVIKKKLKENAQKGFEHITFTGGEPTLHPDILDLVRFAKRLKYKTYISSNGGLFSSNKFCKEITPFLDEICFSVHGYNAELHNLLCGNKSSFSRVNRALKNLENSKSDIFGFINIVLTKNNFPFIEKTIHFVSQFKKIKQILISNIAPEGSGLKNFRNLTVPLSEIKKKVPFFVETARKKSLKIRFFGLPLCILGGYEIYSNDIYWSSRLTLEKWKKGDKTILKETLSDSPSRNRMYVSKCKDCIKKGLCGGIFKEYIKEFGDEEINKGN